MDVHFTQAALKPPSAGVLPTSHHFLWKFRPNFFIKSGSLLQVIKWLTFNKLSFPQWPSRISLFYGRIRSLFCTNTMTEGNDRNSFLHPFLFRTKGALSIYPGARGVTNLAVTPSFHHGHDDVLRGHERQFLPNAPFNYLEEWTKGQERCLKVRESYTQ